MNRNATFTVGVIVYLIVMTFAVDVFSVSLPTATLLMLGIPTMMLARFSAAPSVLIFTIVGFAAGITFLLEGVAHIYGLWSIGLVGEQSLIALGIVTISLLKIVFLVLFYELIFDDGVYQLAQARNRFLEFIFFGVGALVLVWMLAKVFNNLQSATAYYWITVVLLFTSVAALSIWKRLTQRFFRKMLTFVAIAALPMLCIEIVLVNGGYKEILSMLHPVAIPFFDLSLPAGEILLALSLPAFIATIYELYIDDGK